ncbi:Phosphoinositides binding protein [Komagataella phaffii CBS 7435]|uniref:Protein that contains a Phox homology (PX) domain and binds phosphoinositides n=2 Tax=Komagataella phaffii TaxID=460519 RepID=C4R4Z4_KOMPG|nr:Protein that contains a Phox homology (PX) domain and binds phosphoinositides [Komagataella phaffii GS115]AOA64230.1 GQ67_03657T0 [Komagataella phaffii]CAH2449603.1 Putative phosphoinositides binding protein [Komagataella phaffii CBS 7435]AOA68449.1 GQ68_03629T0 [Komagataella phaffii GS115]CAY70630.1 Protein that contains a Phox homology (PX) domain and binds phosphoinositides [Komagataella phaffii GS115]CCA39582.1 Phosphoinositides binding protein [Komagataella phaffii CBS 7435]
MFSPTQEHYLKKELLEKELLREIQAMSPNYGDVTGLRKFGPPFAPYDPINAPDSKNLSELLQVHYQNVEIYNEEFPLLRFFFTNFLQKFPFLQYYENHNVAKKSTIQEQLWINKVQQFYEIWKSKRISTSNDRGSLSKRKLLIYKIVKMMLMMYNTAILVSGDDEYFKNPSESETSDGRLMKNAYKDIEKILPNELINVEEILHNRENYINGLYINVCGVVKDKMKSKIKSINPLSYWYSDTAPTMKSIYLFIILVKDETTGETYYVKRRYSDFKNLDSQLLRHFPGKQLPSAPSKIKMSSELNEEMDDTNADDVDVTSLESNDPVQNVTKKLSDFKDSVSKSAQSGNLFNLNGNTSKQEILQSFPREKLRLALRGYVQNLIRIPEVRSCSILKEFLKKDCYHELSNKEEEEIKNRMKLDDLLIIQQVKFQQEIVNSVNNLQVNINQLKEQIFGNGETGEQGLLFLFKEIEMNTKVVELSPQLQSFIELFKLEVASTIYDFFVSSDSSIENFTLLTKIHQFFPYKIVQTILRFTNPMTIMKKMIDLFLYQPLGSGKSLMQFVFTHILNDDLKRLEKELLFLNKNITSKYTGGDVLVAKIDEYMEEEDNNVIIDIKATCHKYNIDLVLALLLNSNQLKTKIDQKVLVEVLASYKKWSNDDLGSDEAKLYIDLRTLFETKLRRRDKDLSKELWDSPYLIQLIKELIAIFFQPLIVIFTKANLHKYIPIFKSFIEDLIDLIKRYHNDYNSMINENGSVVLDFVAVLTKYQDYLLEFIHNLYMNDGKGDDEQVFMQLIQWFNSFIKLLTFVKTQRPDLKIDLNAELDQFVSLHNSQVEDDSQKINLDKLRLEIDRKIQEINRRKEAYQNILVSKDNGENNPANLVEQDLLAQNRNKMLTKNWNEIHGKLFSELDKGDSKNSFVQDVLGIHQGEMDELNLEFLEWEEHEREDPSNSIVFARTEEEALSAIDQEYLKHGKETFKNFIEADEFENVTSHVKTELNKLFSINRGEFIRRLSWKVLSCYVE